MFAFFFVLASILCMGAAMLAFLAWVIHEHLDARRYRHLIALSKCLPQDALRGVDQGDSVDQWMNTGG